MKYNYNATWKKIFFEQDPGNDAGNFGGGGNKRNKWKMFLVVQWFLSCQLLCQIPHPENDPQATQARVPDAPVEPNPQRASV